MAIEQALAGQLRRPDGLRNQIEGGIVQSLSWGTFEALSFNANGRTAANWDGYPIMRFADVPDSVQVHLVDRPGEAFLGAGEAAQGHRCADARSTVQSRAAAGRLARRRVSAFPRSQRRRPPPPPRMPIDRDIPEELRCT